MLTQTLLSTRLGSLDDAAASLPLVQIYYLFRIDIPGFFARVHLIFLNSCWQKLIDITKFLIYIYLKLLTLLHFVVDAFVSISFRELILMS